MATSKQPYFFWMKILLFAIGLFLLNVWAARIFGDQIKNLVWTNVVLAIAGIAGFLFKLFPEDETKQLQSKIRELMYIFISKRFLGWFFLVFFVVSSLLTSIIVESDETGIPIKAYATAGNASALNKNGKTIDKDEHTTRFIKIVHPLGRKFTVSAEGYSAKSFRVFPWIGKKVNLEEDLNPSLTLWVRFPSTLVNTLLDQCSLLIFHKEDTLYNVETEKGFGSMLIGRKLSLTDDRLSLWKSEASAYFSVDGPDLELALLGWQNVRHVNSQADLTEVDELKFFLKHSSGMILANGEYKRSKEPIIDILLKR